MKCILITGAAGFLGRHVARGFKKNGPAYIIGMGTVGGEGFDFRGAEMDEFHACPVTLPNLLKHGRRPSVIVHCAGGGSVGFSLSNPLADFHKTVGSLAELLEFIRVHSPDSALVYPSSAAVYGMAPNPILDETTPPAPISPYGVHKQMAESLCLSYVRNYQIKAAIVRFFSIYGAGLRKQLLWDACEKLTAGRREFSGTGSEIRDWVHVTDAVSLLAVAAQRASIACPIINGGSGEGVAVGSMLAEISRLLELEGSVTFTGERRAGDPTSLVADQRLAKAWGWVPAVSRDDGLRAYINWYQNHAANRIYSRTP